MAGYNYEVGRSNNMVAAEERGMITIGRWARRHGVSAAAAVDMMRPTEAHHTGTGRPGKSRLTPVIGGDLEPAAEQVRAMKEFDIAAREAKNARPRVYEHCSARYLTWPTTRTARRFPTERFERGLRVEIHADGQVVVMDLGGRRTRNWQKRSGLVMVDRTGAVLINNCDPNYDDLREIVRSLSQPPTGVLLVPPPSAAPAKAAAVEPAREPRPLTGDEIAALDAMPDVLRQALIGKKRKEIKQCLFQARLASRAEALDYIASSPGRGGEPQ